ncbi:peroxisomal biogenesis factor 11 [Piromyces finnis]|uniref:Peroxisomal biogenesis factor 11 n=1 Tax=Piromyces finnis TaxID=1754191 RepID=A0A1Y1VHH9_9FUNG|nr:peroxisomal biogenesis factor 11 [Piromyces finnis]|eukprot:ORX56492.1 peroxisomal biogenesis factor 11 [Piromyces finnis]
MNENSSTKKILKYIHTTTGRDKINRTLQYIFKLFLAYNIKYNNNNEETIILIRKIITNITLSRKFVRIGRPLEHLNTFYISLNLKDDFSKYCVIIRNLAYAIYLTFDMMIWIYKSGIMKFENFKIIYVNSQLFWLIGIIFGILNEIYKLKRNSEKITEIYECNISDEKESKKRKNDDLKDLSYYQKNHYLTLTQHSCDLLQPISSLGIFVIEPILLALFGIVSSVIGARNQWIKVNGK